MVEEELQKRSPAQKLNSGNEIQVAVVSFINAVAHSILTSESVIVMRAQ